MKWIYFFSGLTLLLLSCRSGSSLSAGKNLHEEYGKKLSRAGLDQTELGRQWFSMSQQALSNPRFINLPHSEKGYFPSEKARAVGLRFDGKRGQKLLFSLVKNPSSGFALFADLWQLEESGPSLLMSVDTSGSTFEYEVEEDAVYILRLQPELLRSGDYTLSISIGPSLRFPVSGKVGRVGSFWGDTRDAGARSHEGIDIFAPKRTPVIAAADGRVRSVGENRLGGKVVFMRPSDKNYTLYYAHLDEQLVSSGQYVHAGDTLGLIGNTGNARHTPPHLHFGIYTRGGAVDPFPFVDPQVKLPPRITQDMKTLKSIVRLNKRVALTALNKRDVKNCPANTVVRTLSASPGEYLVELPDEMLATMATSTTEPLNTIKQGKLTTPTFLLESPMTDAPNKRILQAESMVKIYGYFASYAFVILDNEEEGWIPLSVLQ